VIEFPQAALGIGDGLDQLGVILGNERIHERKTILEEVAVGFQSKGLVSHGVHEGNPSPWMTRLRPGRESWNDYRTARTEPAPPWKDGLSWEADLPHNLVGFPGHPFNL
jgi:hypothetical protein